MFPPAHGAITRVRATGFQRAPGARWGMGIIEHDLALVFHLPTAPQGGPAGTVVNVPRGVVTKIVFAVKSGAFTGRVLHGGQVRLQAQLLTGFDVFAFVVAAVSDHVGLRALQLRFGALDRKSTRLNSSHLVISYAVFCLKKKTNHSPRFIRRKRTPP